MKPIRLLVALILLGCCSPPSRGQEAAKETDVIPHLKGLEQAWGDAIVKRDTRALDRILANDHTLTTPEGKVVTRAQVLQTFRSPPDASFAIKGVNLEEMGVRVFGDTALVTSRFTLRIETEGRNIETPFRHLDVFVKQQDGWRCVARQATRIRQSYGHNPGD